MRIEDCPFAVHYLSTIIEKDKLTRQSGMSFWQTSGCGGQIARRAPDLCSLLESVGQFDERWLAIRSTHEGNAEWQLEDKTGGHADAWIPGQRRRLTTPAGEVIPIHQVDPAGQADRRHDQRIQFVFVHHGV